MFCFSVKQSNKMAASTYVFFLMMVVVAYILQDHAIASQNACELPELLNNRFCIHGGCSGCYWTHVGSAELDEACMDSRGGRDFQCCLFNPLKCI